MRMRTLFTTASAMALSFGVMAGAASAGQNDLFVEQVGTNNFAGTGQDGSGNQSYVYQEGNYNSAGAGSDVTELNDRNNQGVIRQEGSKNVASWSMQAGTSDGRFRDNTLGIVQTTDRNFAKFNMGQGDAPQNVSLFVWQGEGNQNYVGNGAAGFTDVGNSAGNGGTARIYPIGVAGVQGSQNFSVPASETDQSAAVRGSGHIIGIEQMGTRNAMALSVSGSGNVIGGPDSAENDSFGDLNAQTQNGGFFSGAPTVNPADGGVWGLSGPAQQLGTDNVAVVGVSGTSNAVSLIQADSNNTAEVYQSGGSGNYATAHQR